MHFSSLQGTEEELFRMVAFDASDEQWRDWLRLPLELAAARGNLDLVTKLLDVRAKRATGPLCTENRTLLAVVKM